ncbi:biopolymer transporter ExbD [Massilia sp. TS11]|uniref:biopolymer transporter ExbD n=1 Tax=Massilia sp. TS11 TaxID=2908003 RepID=UPI001EDA0C88|nr:biopolymer transporter ExbD [Massilia sp. TS11]MCG2586149.1 biopolymer transporter ExbD [Massilia sp. TS11]
MASFSSMRGGRRRKFKSEINVVPYIDVMLVLLIIFMAVPQTQNPSEIKLPSAEKSTQPPDDLIRIELKPNATLSLSVRGKNAQGAQDYQERQALLRDLRALHDKYPDTAVLIAGDKDVKYDEVIQLISEAKKMGINRVGLATK